MPGPFDQPPMTAKQFEEAMRSRGFSWSASANRWVGPFGLTVTGVANQSNYHSTSGRDNPMGIGSSGIDGGSIGPGVSGLRKTLLADIDEQLRAKRGLPRAPFRPPYSPPNQPAPPH